MGKEPEKNNSEMEALSITSFLPSVNVLSAIIVVICAVVYFLWPQLYPPARQTYSVGDVSVHHSFANRSCETCHTASFQRVSDGACSSCHKLTSHIPTDNKLHEIHAAKEGMCIDCHTEHKGELIRKSDTQCLQCHSNMDSLLALANVTDKKVQNVASWRSHPEFNTSPDTATLLLNHAVHLKEGLQGDKGPETLHCGSCHTMDVRNERMNPIKYETHCGRCHTLEFDERASGTQVPHGDVQNVLTFMQGVYARMALTGKVKIVRGDEDRLLDPTSIQSPQFVEGAIWKEVRSAETVLFTKTGCVLCHQVSKVEGTPLPGTPRYEVKKVSVNSIWMPKADFAHSAHQQLKCESCHGDVSKSEKSTDLLIPKKEKCMECHAASPELSNCVTCHDYHDPIPLERNKQRSTEELLR